MDVETWMKFTSLIIIDTVGLIGNIIMLITGVKNKNLRKFQNVFIFNMATADLLQCILIMPASIINVWNGGWLFSSTGCDIFAIVKVAITLASVYSLSGISMQRYFHVVKRTKKMNSLKAISAGIIFVWVISIFLAVTPYFGWGEFGFEDGKEVCTVLFHKTPSHTLTVFVTSLFLNIFIMIFCYGSIFLTLRKSESKLAKSRDEISFVQRTLSDNEIELKNNNIKKDDSVVLENKCANDTITTFRIRGFTGSSPSNFSSKELHLLKTVVVVIIVFICCWTPYVIFNMIRTFGGSTDINSVDTVTMWLGFINSAVNPVLYGVLNRQFKTAMKEVVLCH